MFHLIRKGFQQQWFIAVSVHFIFFWIVIKKGTKKASEPQHKREWKSKTNIISSSKAKCKTNISRWWHKKEETAQQTYLSGFSEWVSHYIYYLLSRAYLHQAPRTSHQPCYQPITLWYLHIFSTSELLNRRQQAILSTTKQGRFLLNDPVVVQLL